MTKVQKNETNCILMASFRLQKRHFGLLTEMCISTNYIFEKKPEQSY
jgi:hypothetical protein